MNKFHQNKGHARRQTGFTLVELIVYVAVSSVILVGMIQFSWDIIGAGTKVNTSTELSQNARLVLEQEVQQIRTADEVLMGSSTFNSHPGVLTLNISGINTVIDTYTKSVIVGGQSKSIRKLRIKKGAASAVDLTSDKINVTNFNLKNLTRDTEPANIKMELTLKDLLDDHSISLQTSASIRKQ